MLRLHNIKKFLKKPPMIQVDVLTETQGKKKYSPKKNTGSTTISTTPSSIHHTPSSTPPTRDQKKYSRSPSPTYPNSVFITLLLKYTTYYAPTGTMCSHPPIYSKGNLI
jgi:hypothetical protein